MLRYVRSAVKLPFETSTRLLSDSAVVTTRVIPAGFADNHIIDFEIDLLKYNMLTDFLVRLTNLLLIGIVDCDIDVMYISL